MIGNPPTETPPTEKPPTGKPTYDDCCEDLLCWENCFVDPAPEFKETYDKIYKVLNYILYYYMFENRYVYISDLLVLSISILKL